MASKHRNAAATHYRMKRVTMFQASGPHLAQSTAFAFTRATFVEFARLECSRSHLRVNTTTAALPKPPYPALPELMPKHPL